MTQRLLRVRREQVYEVQRNLSSLNPILVIKQGLVRIPHLSKRLEGRMCVTMEHHRHWVRATLAQLNSLSPLAVLGRGYSILQTVPAGQIVHRASDVETGQELEAQLVRGRLSCVVTRVLDDSPV